MYISMLIRCQYNTSSELLTFGQGAGMWDFLNISISFIWFYCNVSLVHFYGPDRWTILLKHIPTKMILGPTNIKTSRDHFPNGCSLHKSNLVPQRTLSFAYNAVLMDAASTVRAFSTTDILNLYCSKTCTTVSDSSWVGKK